jgi:hypothetical protein
VDKEEAAERAADEREGQHLRSPCRSWAVYHYALLRNTRCWSAVEGRHGGQWHTWLLAYFSGNQHESSCMADVIIKVHILCHPQAHELVLYHCIA